MQGKSSGKRDGWPLGNIEIPDVDGQPYRCNGLGRPPDTFGDGVFQWLKLHGRPDAELPVGLGDLQTGKHPRAENLQPTPAIDVIAVHLNIARQNAIGAAAAAGVTIAAIENLCGVLQQVVDRFGAVGANPAPPDARS
jgi:hypothetical protein